MKHLSLVAWALSAIFASALAFSIRPAPLAEAVAMSSVPCGGCGLVTGFPQLATTAGMELVIETGDGGPEPGLCHCDPWCKQKYGCGASTTVTIYAYGAPGIGWAAISIDGGGEGARFQVTSNVYTLFAYGNCDEVPHDMTMNLYQNQHDSSPAARLAYSMKCYLCSGDC